MRGWGRLAAALILILAGAAAAATPGINGRDDRRPLLHPDPSLDAVGRVNHGGSFCTGTLIAADQVLTAAHCLWDTREHRLVAPGQLHFLAGWRRGRYAGHAVAVSVELAPDLRLGADGVPADPLTDWAVLTLERPLAGPALRPMPFAGAADRARVADGAKLARIGYGRDRPHLPVLVEPCHVLGVVRAGRMLLNDCDATYGDSGSPILIATSDGYALVAMETALLHATGDVVGAALVLGQRRNLPASALAGKDPAP
ncbi:MAG: trypsin-like serine peptidase [Geminicoccaceae bacterium]|jgi:protease YdgD